MATCAGPGLLLEALGGGARVGRRVDRGLLRFRHAPNMEPHARVFLPRPVVAALQAWELTGDAYSTHKGDRPWISEM